MARGWTQTMVRPTAVAIYAYLLNLKRDVQFHMVVLGMAIESGFRSSNIINIYNKKYYYIYIYK